MLQYVSRHLLWITRQLKHLIYHTRDKKFPRRPNPSTGRKNPSAIWFRISSSTSGTATPHKPIALSPSTFVYCIVLYLNPIRFLRRLGDRWKINYGRSAIGAERPLVIPLVLLLRPQLQVQWNARQLSPPPAISSTDWWTRLLLYIFRGSQHTFWYTHHDIFWLTIW